MFDILKKKITNFVDNLTSKIKGDEKKEELKAEIKETPRIEEKIEEIKKETAVKPLEIQGISEKNIEEKIEKISEVKKAIKEVKEERTKEAKKEVPLKELKELRLREEHKSLPVTPVKKAYEPAPEIIKKVETKEPKKQLEIKEAKELETKPTLFTKIKSFITPEVTIKEEDIRSVIEDFELQLLTSDVAVPVVEEIVSELKKKLVGKKIEYKNLNLSINQSITAALMDVMSQEKFDLINYVNSKEKPVKILFIGPNGAGKTTTIAKLANLIKLNGLSPILAASDTFRAAAIEQTAEHASRIDVPIIRHQYGSDPAAVAFDAIKYAETHKLDVVLIDTAGRQETNRNLIEQLKKITRVVKPDLKIFVGEGIAGNAIISQVKEFNEAIGLDGVILTKIDVDTKGGTVISVKKATGVPIFYIGIGQGYEDFVPFDPSFVASKIMS